MSRSTRWGVGFAIALLVLLVTRTISLRPQVAETAGPGGVRPLPATVGERFAEQVALSEALRDRRMPPAEKPAAPASLRDTAVDGALPVDAGGHLVVGPEVRRLFDYFLSAGGEESPQRLHQRIAAVIAERLAEPARGEALQLLDRYQEYRERARALFASGSAEADLGARLDQVHALRRAVFGAADAEALFGDEEARDFVAVAMHEVARDITDPAERAARLGELEAQLPPEARAARQAATLPQRLSETEAALRAAGGSDAEIRALREEMVGAEAAQRLADLDQRRGEWQARVDDYRDERRAIAVNDALSEGQKRERIDALIASRFNGPEQTRVRALDRIGGD